MKKIQIFLACIIFSFACSNNDTESKAVVYKPDTKWVNYFKEIGYTGSLSNTVWLVTHFRQCAGCINELSFWEDHRKQVSASVNLIILEPNESNIEIFASRNSLSFDTFQDQSSIIATTELMPYTPIKIYFNEVGKATKQSLGDDSDLQIFLDLLN